MLWEVIFQYVNPPLNKSLDRIKLHMDMTYFTHQLHVNACKHAEPVFAFAESISLGGQTVGEIKLGYYVATQ